MPEVTEDQMPTEGPITCSFCGLQDVEGDPTIIIVGTMGANICERCVVMCAKAIASARTQPQVDPEADPA